MAAVTIALAAGIAAAQRASFVVCALIVGMVLLVACAVIRRYSRATMCILAAMFLLGAARYAVDMRILPDDIARHSFSVSAFEGVVASDPEARGDRVSMVFGVERAQVHGHWRDMGGLVLVNFYQKHMPSLQYGDRATITASIYPPMEPTNPGQFSWGDYLARQGIFSCASVRSSGQVEVIPGEKGNLLVTAAMKAKHYLVRSIQRIHPREEASVIVGMVLGTYSYLPPDVFRNFTVTGTLHMLAASGYNCYLLLVLAMPILKLPLVSRIITPKRRNIVVIGLIVMYLLMVGAKPSLVRASVMASLLLLAMPLRRVANVRNLFFVSAFIVLMMTPSDLFDVGFQLSYLSVWALIAVSPTVESLFARAGIMPGRSPRRANPIVRYSVALSGLMAGAVVATTAITLVTGPLVAYYFNYISLVSIPANMALELGVPFVFAAGLASSVAAHFAPLGNLVGAIGTGITRGMLEVVNCLGSMSHSAVAVAAPSTVALLGYYVVLYAAVSYVRSRVA